jgi:membrane protease YdiL (CAAX protease family)
MHGEHKLSSLTPYLALASFPLATWLAPNPTRFSWGFRHGLEPMPVEVRDKAESTDRYWYFIVDAITIAFVIALMLRNGIPAARVGVRLAQWKNNVVVGVAAGIVSVLFQSLLTRFFPNAVSGSTVDHYRRRSVTLWVFVFVSGAFAEEFWIAFCLVTLRAAGHSAVISVVATAVVFGAVHFTYRFGAIAVAIKGAASALLFLLCGSLIPMFLVHFIGNLGSLYWLRAAQPSAPPT